MKKFIIKIASLIIPEPCKPIIIKSIGTFLSNTRYRNVEKIYCPYCNHTSHPLPFGRPTRPKAMCPHCNSLERHRGLYYIYTDLFLNRDDEFTLYHMAPERSIYDLISKHKNINYITGDLNPSNYKFDKNCQCIDVTKLPFENESIDIILSNHVMEHIPDESKFLGELSRVLKKDGKIILTVPFFKGLETTLEDDKYNTDELRLKYYGQEDHVRKYGRDVFDRLKKFFSLEYIDDKDGDGLGNGGYFILSKL